MLQALFALTLFFAFFISSSSLAALSHERYSGDVAGLAQGCFSIQLADQNYLSINLSGEYSFNSKNLMHAGQFHFKPSSFNQFLLADRYRNTLSRSLTSVSTVDLDSVWTIEKTGHELYSLSNGDQVITGMLIEQHFCKNFSEIDVNVSGERDVLKVPKNNPIRGIVDTQAHIASYESIGGKFIYGAPFHRFGVEHALGNCEHIHGPEGKLDFFTNLFSKNSFSSKHKTQGWPKFHHWPNDRSVTHSHYYYRWIERAYLGGIRIMVSQLVDNEQLCIAQTKSNPAAWINGNSCNTMDSLHLQAKRHFELQDYIDAQAGGKGKGFFRIVSSSKQARDVIEDGKLAIVLSADMSSILNCSSSKHCDEQSAEENLKKLHTLGIRSIYSSNKLNSNSSSTRFDNTRLQDAQIENPDGLNGLATSLFRQMIALKMLIEIDHSNEKSSSDIMNLIESHAYNGIVSRNQGVALGTLTPNQLERFIRAGGFIAPSVYPNHAKSSSLDERTQIEYPFTSESGLNFHLQQSGLKEFDYNESGIAHYGLLADHIQAIRKQTDNKEYETLMQSAEAYLQMWARSEQ